MVLLLSFTLNVADAQVHQEYAEAHGGGGYHGISNFIDHDPGYPDTLLDYMGGKRTYDLSTGYNHKGTDYFTWPFSWIMMDNDIVEVVTAAPGTILQSID